MGATVTLPMTYMTPQNPAQSGGATLNPQQTATNLGGVLGATTPTAGVQPNPSAGFTGTTYGLPFGGANPTLPTSGTAPISISQGISTADKDYSFMGDFKDTYGAGVGSTLANTLANLGTSTNVAVQAANQQILSAAQDQYSNLLGMNAARGVDPSSSSAALLAGDFAAKVNTSLQATDAAMEQQGLNTLISAMQDEGSAHGADTSGWDVFGQVMNSIGSIAGSVAGLKLPGGGTIGGSIFSKLFPTKSSGGGGGGGILSGLGSEWGGA